MLYEQGWPVAAAGSVTSIVLWLVIISIPPGGFIADRTGTHSIVLLGGLVAFAAMLLIATRAQAVIPAFVLRGVVCGLSVGPVMSLPARMLLPETRAVGMGVFYTVFYVINVVAPWLGGCAASVAESSRAALDLGAAMVFASCAVFWLFERLVGS